jgi:thiol:disulfide interchange protein
MRVAHWSRAALAMLLVFAVVGAACAPAVGWQVPADQPGCVQLCLVYAPWCAACPYAKPTVLHIATERGSQVHLRVLLQASPEGQAFAAHYGARCLPAVIVLDREGRPLTPVRCGLTSYTDIDALVAEALSKVSCS